MEKKTVTTVINLYGGPGSGKSTLAAGTFYDLKRQGLKVELVTEFVKEWAYQGKKIDWHDSLSILTNQLAREAALYGKVDYIITDSPLFLSVFYEQYYSDRRILTAIKKEVEKELLDRNIEHINFYIPASYDDNYQTIGRYENLEESKKVHESMKNWLQEHVRETKHLTSRDSSEIIKCICKGKEHETKD